MNEIIDPNVKNPVIPDSKNFASLDEAYKWALSLVRPNTVQLSRIAADRFKKPRQHMVQLIGVEPKAAKFCTKMDPTGEWRVEVENPGTVEPTLSIMGTGERPIKYMRFSAWYNRFLPYAYAMMKAEYDFKCMGIDYECINSYYKTCMGFVDMGLDNHPGRFVNEDMDLFNNVYNSSMAVRSPQLPFDEAYAPCSVYVALRKPKEIVKHCEPDSWIVKHVREVCEHMNVAQPLMKWKKAA